MAERNKRPVSAPAQPLPAGAWDCHAHVFGPFDRWPLLEDRRNEPPLAPAEDYLEMLDTVGFRHGVVVHAQAKGNSNDNAADTLSRRPADLRGVGYLPPGATDADFQSLHDRGFRALRITENGKRAPGTPGSLTFDDLDRLAPRMREMGWHVDIWGRCELIVPQMARIESHGLPVIFDHMGHFAVSDAGLDPNLPVFVDYLKQTGFYAKLTVIRVTRSAWPHDDVRPYHDALVAAVPDQLVFGTDWPYISLDAAPPDAGRFVDLFDDWTRDAGIRQKVFVENPARFHGAG